MENTYEVGIQKVNQIVWFVQITTPDNVRFCTNVQSFGQPDAARVLQHFKETKAKEWWIEC